MKYSLFEDLRGCAEEVSGFWRRMRPIPQMALCYAVFVASLVAVIVIAFIRPSMEARIIATFGLVCAIPFHIIFKKRWNNALKYFGYIALLGVTGALMDPRNRDPE